MTGALLLAAAVVGVDYGWQPRPDGGFEYIIQLEPEALDALRAGQDIRSEVPPFLRSVSAYRLTTGRGTLPRVGTPVLPQGAPTPHPEVADRAPRAPQTFVEPDESSVPTPWSNAQAEPAPESITPAADTLHMPPDGQWDNSGSILPPALHSPDDAPHAGYEPNPENSPPAPLPDDHVDHASYSPALDEEPTGADDASAGSAKAPLSTTPVKWWMLAAACSGWLLSLGGNFYQGWLHLGLRRRYVRAMRRLRELGAIGSERPGAIASV